MITQATFETPTILPTGRIAAEPTMLLHREVLEPQFAYECQHLLRWYLLIEKVLLLEYVRLGMVEGTAAQRIAAVLNEINEETIAADPRVNMSDIAFAIERYVEGRATPPPAWHVDRSRNDFQACAQLLFGRQLLLTTATLIEGLATVICKRAKETANLVMPGYTHFQAAQIISPGFYLAAINEQLVNALHRVIATYDAINRCPLGAGAMAGQELAWDRQRMATMLGFGAPVAHALVAVASREWVLLIGAELSLLGTMLSRFVTDLMLWGSSEYQFIDLPDSMAGISSAMPQKKNFPVLERVRGKTAHLGAFYVDVMLGQRNTPFTNLVEVSKEASAQLFTTCQTAHTALKLLTSVVDHIQFRTARLAQTCEREFFGGFALANYLTLHHNIPARVAQIITGQAIVAALEQGQEPQGFDPALLEAACAAQGFQVKVVHTAVGACMAPESNMISRATSGSTHPAHVHALIDQHEQALANCRHALTERQATIDAGRGMIDTLLQA